MTFHDVQFPTAISFGSRGGPGFSTAIVETDSGAEERTARWATARRRYNARWGIKSYDDLYSVVQFYIARLGCAHSFRFKDWLDFTTASNGQSSPSDTDCTLGTGDGTTVAFQLRKQYTSGGYSQYRNITKPVDGTIVVSLDDVSQGSGWSVNTSTGIVTFTSAPAVGVIVKAGCEFDVHVRFGEEVDEELGASLNAYDNGDIPDIPIVEVRDEAAIEDDFFYGGAKDHGAISADVSITVAEGRIQTFDPQSAGLKIYLPDTTSLPGGCYLWLANLSSSNAIDIKDSGGVAVATLAASGKCIVVLSDNHSGTKTWYAFA